MNQQVKVWDVAIRVFHWSLVLFFTLAYITGEEESGLHIFSGYVVLALIAFRLLWGVVGTRYARFSQLSLRLSTVRAYLASIVKGRPLHYLGHNPLGSWMVVALLLSLSLTSWTGLELYGSAGKGPLANHPHVLVTDVRANGHDNGDGERYSEWWEEIHEASSNLTLTLAFLHIAGVLFSSAIHRENLIRAMVTGYKRQR